MQSDALTGLKNEETQNDFNNSEVLTSHNFGRALLLNVAYALLC
jgi:hypothetical protein